MGEGSSCDIKKGDRVCYCNIPYGSYSEGRLIHAKHLLKAPDDIPDSVIAASFYKCLFALYLTNRIYFIRDDITVMVHDVTSDMGDILCQWIKARSQKCKIIGTVNSDTKIAIAKNLGCDLVLNYTQNIKDLHRNVMEFTNGYGVSAVYDCVGKDTYLLSLNSLSMFGLYLLYEQRSGPIPPMAWQSFRARSLFFTYPSLFHYTKSAVDFAMSAAEVFHFLQKGIIKPKIAKKYKLQEVKNAHKDLESGNMNGSLVIEI